VSQAGQPAIHDIAVRRQLEKILAHDLFARAERMGRFLRFAVERALEGKAGDLKEYLIGVEVFDRKDSYDPRVDPIVRVEARRLRSKLKAYYEGDGRSDPVVIEFHSGGYAPHIRAAAPPPGPVLAPARTEVATVAVLPFVNLSPSADEYFSDGLTEELIHALTKLPGMRVVAWTTAAQMRDRQQDILAIRERLNVGNVLTGSVRISGTSLRVRAQLIDTATGVYRWSETFDRAMEDVFAIQEEIALAIVRTLDIQRSAGAGAGMAQRSRGTISSYDWYLKGRYFWHRRTPEDLKHSVRCFENAIAADAESALAQAGLADAYSVIADYGLAKPADVMPKAEAAAERAITLEPELAEAYSSLALIRGLYRWRWEEAERLYLRAIQLNPGYAPAHHWLGVDHYAVLERFDEAERELEIALQLDPLSSIMLEGRPYVMVLRRRYAEALEYYRQLQRLDPAFYKFHTSMGRCCALAGDYTEALALLKSGRSLAGDVPSILAAMGQISAAAGDRHSARCLLQELKALSNSRYVPCTSFAIIHLGLEEIDEAFEWLERGCENRDLAMPMLKVHPLYDPLRGDKRFQKLLQRLRLE
jgi:serine/threonine-protein kinase